MKVKDDFHQLIDTIDDENTLKSYYQLIKNLNNVQEGNSWNALTAEQKEELLLAYEESFDEVNLVGHEEVKNEYSKWLKNNLA